jgi:Na+-driven multidrug efflux pump
MIYAVAVQGAIAVTVFALREPMLAWSGARGDVLEVASTFLGISVLSLPLIALGMSAAAILRAAGEAWRAMMVTTTGGLVALVVDPVLIIWLDLGVPGAAIAIVISRLVMACAGLYWVAQKGLLARPAGYDLRDTMAPFLAIALPAVATQVSTPFGNWVLIRAMAEHGESAVAGLGVAARLQILGFGGIFALSGAIGGIIGQNHGANLPDRVRQSYIDALKFCAVYTAVVWALMVVFAAPLARAFGLSGLAAEVVHWFAWIGAGSFMFTGALFVANAAFNNLGRPIWATMANWARDGGLMAPLAFGLGAVFAAPGVIAGQAAANVLAGVLAAWVGWRFVSGGLDRAARPA